jgi:hypothetical protein
MRITPSPFIAKLQQQGYVTNDYELLDSYEVATHHKPAFYFKRLRQLPAGLTEWAIHPSLTTPELQAVSDSWPVRQADFEFLMSAETRHILQQEGIIVLNYRPLQKLWQAR